MVSRPRVVVAYARTPAHVLLRAEAGRFHHVPATSVVLGHACPGCGSDEHGRPHLLATAAIRHPAWVSLARAGELSVVAMSDVGPVGVDVERSDADITGLDSVALHADEHPTEGADLLRTWVRKEALLKACGAGLAVDPREVRLDPDGLASWESAHPAPGSVWLREVDITGHATAVALLPPADLDVATLMVTVLASG